MNAHDGIEATGTSDGDRVMPHLILFDLNETLLYRPWDGKSVDQTADTVVVSTLPVGPSGICSRMYHRPGVEELLRSLMGKVQWGFCTDMLRANAINVIRALLGKALVAEVEEASGVSLKVRPLGSSTGPQQSEDVVLLF